MMPEYSVTMRIIAGPVVWPLGSAPTCPVKPAAIFAADDLPVPWSPVMYKSGLPAPPPASPFCRNG